MFVFIIYSKYHEVQAEYFRVQSKYMVLLQEAQNPRIGEKTIDNLELIIPSGVSPGVTLFHSTFDMSMECRRSL